MPCLAVVLAAIAESAGAQTDYYNTDVGRPVSIEDAYPVERFAFELQLAPVRLERRVGGLYAWQFEPELAYGVLPRTQVELGVPLEVADGTNDSRVSGLRGLELSLLYNLNVETASFPALAFAAEALLPVGTLAPDDPYVFLKAIITRTLPFVRIHLNGSWTWGPDAVLDETGEVPDDISRWAAGVAVDRTFPLRSALLTAAVYAEQPPLFEEAEVRWSVETGLRYQWSPTVSVDAGVAARLTGLDRGWAITFGAAYAFAIRSLIPVS